MSERRSISITPLVVALVAILICVDAALLLTRREADVAVSQMTKSAAAGEQDAPQSPVTEVKRRAGASPQAAQGPVVVVGEWGMGRVGDGSDRAGDLRFSGGRRQVPGVIGGAVQFTGAPSSGVAEGTGNFNPGVADFAMSLVFTSRAIPSGVGYSGNLIQKGRSYSQGQVKLQLVPAHGGTVLCTVKGSDGARLLPSRVNVDDGKWHTASCWREGSRIGLTVDGVTRTDTLDVGTIASLEPVRVGNKSALAGASDQHVGANDCAVYLIGDNAKAAAARLTPC
jgi:hypothetical protein